MKNSIENLANLSERAEAIRVETDALFTAVKIVMGKEKHGLMTKQIPLKWQSQYERQVDEKVNLIRSKRRNCV